MKSIITIAVLWLSILSTQAQNQVPIISNFTVQADIQNGSASLFYDLGDAEDDLLEVTVQFSTNGGRNFSTLSSPNVTGDVGPQVIPGSRMANCSNLDFSAAGKYVFRIIADDHQPFDIQALVNQVDSNRLRDNLKFVEGIRHRSTGLAHLLETRDSIRNLFETSGLFFESQDFNFSGFTGKNLLGSLPGTATDSLVVIIDAHYDSFINAPGADDNGSGTVGVMEIAQILSRYPSKKTQRYIGFDLEESGLIGSIRYVTNGIPANEQIEGVFNFEMIGYWSDQPNTQTLPAGFSTLFPAAAQEVANNEYRGDFITNVGNAASQSLALLFSTAAQQYVPGLKVITLNVPGNGSIVPDLRRSDHAPFWDSGRKALMLTDGANFRNECYHTAGDTLEDKLDFTFMSNVVKATLAAVADLAEIQHADWETASFEVSSGTEQPVDCQFIVLQTNGIAIQADDCFSGAYTLECYDIKGSLVYEQKIQLQNGATAALSGWPLSAGVYVFKLRNAHGTFAQKVLIH